jgi:hypothetical protein
MNKRICWGVQLAPADDDTTCLAETASACLAMLEKRMGDPAGIRTFFENGARLVLVEVTERIISK